MTENDVAAHVGAQLRRLRVLQSIEGQTLAEELGWSGAKLSRIEQGKTRVSVSDLADVLNALGAAEEVRAELLATVAAGDLGAWMVRSGGVVRRQADVGDLEQRVTGFCEYNPLIVPGQLQSRDYTRAMAQVAGFDSERLVSARARRQALLAVEGAPTYRAVLDQRAFARWPGGTDVLIGQIGHLLDRMQLPNVDVRLLPDGPNAKTLALGAFVIYEFVETGPVVLLEHHAIDVFLATGEDIKQYQKTFSDLSTESLPPEETAEWLVSTRKKMTQGS